MADRIVVMNQGAIDQVGTPQEIYRHPTTAFVADFVGSMNFLPGTLLAPDKVKVGGLTFDCPAQDGLALGHKVNLCIRPEDVRVRDLPDDIANRVPIEVTDLDFVGAFCRATLKVRAAPDVAMTADFSSNLIRDLGVQPGSHLDVALPPDRLQGLRRVSLAAPASRSVLRANLSRDDLMMRAGVVVLAGMLLLIVGLPLWALLAKGFEDRDGNFIGLANYLSYFSTPALFDSALNSFEVAAAVTLIVRAARLPLCLCAHPHRAAGALAVPGHLADPDLRALAAARPGAGLPVRQPGLLQGHAGRADLRLRRHPDRPGLLLLPARHPDPGDRARHRRRAALRGGRRAGRLEDPRLLHRHPARRQVRPDQRRAGRVHPGDHRFRHRQGDRRQFQRAGDRRLQAGDRPAELLDGRRGRHGAAGAGGARLRRRPLRAKEAGGAADGARRAADPQAQVRPRRLLHRLLHGGLASPSWASSAWRRGAR